MDSFKCFRKSLNVPLTSSSILTLDSLFTEVTDIKTQIYFPIYKMGKIVI